MLRLPKSDVISNGTRRSFIRAGGAIAILVASGASTACAGDAYHDSIAGPVEARVIKVRDGDTMEVEAFIWPRQAVQVAVRLRGIDAPEHRGKCHAEKRAAEAARERLSELVGNGTVRLTDIAGGKYYGRVLAEVSTAGKGNLGMILLKEGLVVRYQGGSRRNWCSGQLSDASGMVHPSRGRHAGG